MPAQCITPVQLVVEERFGLHPYCTKRVAVEASPNGDSAKTFSSRKPNSEQTVLLWDRSAKLLMVKNRAVKRFALLVHELHLPLGTGITSVAGRES